MDPTHSAFAGTWFTDPDDLDALRLLGLVKLRFEREGEVTVVVHGADRDHQAVVSYRIAGSQLLTDAPHPPLERSTPFCFTPEGRLVLVSSAGPIRFLRVR